MAGLIRINGLIGFSNQTARGSQHTMWMRVCMSRASSRSAGVIRGAIGMAARRKKPTEDEKEQPKRDEANKLSIIRKMLRML